jgi:hypothetical protein
MKNILLHLVNSQRDKLTEGTLKDFVEQLTLLREPQSGIRLVIDELVLAQIQGIELLGSRFLLAQLQTMLALTWLHQLPREHKEAESKTLIHARYRGMQVTIGVAASKMRITRSAMSAEEQALAEAVTFLSQVEDREENLPSPKPEGLQLTSMA